jgi:acyl-CoA thioester hydrolase
MAVRRGNRQLARVPTIREVRFRVRYDETDQGRVVYHSKYLHYFETGRTEFLREEGMRYRDFEDAGNFLVVTEASLRYRAAARYDDEIRVRTWITQVTPATVRFAYEVLRDPEGTLLVEGDTQLACVGTDFRPKRIPPGVAETLRRAAE